MNKSASLSETTRYALDKMTRSVDCSWIVARYRGAQPEKLFGGKGEKEHRLSLTAADCIRETGGWKLLLGETKERLPCNSITHERRF